MKKYLLPGLAIGLLLNLFLSLSALAADRINITAPPYNAIPNDGVSDKPAIDAAILAGRSIYFPPGTYNYPGLMYLTAEQSFRLYGDGPGVSTIAFTGPSAGIYGYSMGAKTLTVEGLTIMANTAKCGTAIQAYFNDTNATKKFHNATIRNVQIIGSSRTSTPGAGYWTGGIRLYQAQNSVLTNIEISGENSEPGTQCPGPQASEFGIIWDSATNYQTSGLQMSNIQIKFVDTALRTNGLVENVFVTGFEFPFCGTNGNPAVDLNSSDSANLGSTFHLVNGHVAGFQHALRMTHLRGVKLSKLSIVHANGQSSPGHECGSSGNDVALTNVTDAVISQCTFIGASGAISDEIGIRLEDSHYVQIAGNYFSNIYPSNIGNGQNACINVQPGSDWVRVINNIFEIGNVHYPYYIPVPESTYKRGNNL